MEGRTQQKDKTENNWTINHKLNNELRREVQKVQKGSYKKCDDVKDLREERTDNVASKRRK